MCAHKDPASDCSIRVGCLVGALPGESEGVAGGFDPMVARFTCMFLAPSLNSCSRLMGKEDLYEHKENTCLSQSLC
jgi:hypothetical protein